MRLASNVPLASLTTLRARRPCTGTGHARGPADFPELVATTSRTGTCRG